MGTGPKESSHDPELGALGIIGKCDMERMAYAPEGARAALDAWLAVRGADPGPILAPISQTGMVRADAGMTPHALMVRLKRRTKQAAIADPAYAQSSACAPGSMETRAQALQMPVIPAQAGIHFGQRIPKLEFPRTEPRPPRRRRYPLNAGSEPRITTSGMTPDSWRRRLVSALTGRSRYARIDGEGMPR